MDQAIAKRLQIKDGRTARVFGAPKSLSTALAGLSSSKKGPVDVVLLFAADRAALAKGAPAALAAMGDGSILWIAYPKKTSSLASDLDRDHGWDVIHKAGFDPVSQVALDDTWSAVRWKKDAALRASRVARGSMLAPKAEPAAKAKAEATAKAKTAPPAKAKAAPKAKTATLKTRPEDAGIASFLDGLAEPRRGEAQALLDLMTRASGLPPRLWSGGIVGFGDTHLRYESGRELDWFVFGFSPRKAAHSLYGLLGDDAKARALLGKLGKHDTGKGCLYVKKLADVDTGVLAELVKLAVARKSG